MMRKQTFLLLEVLIAIALVASCAVPLLVTPIQIFREELRLLEEGERERLADWTFSEIKELMLKNEISWEKLPAYNATAGPFSLEPVKIQIPGREAKTIERSYTILGKGEKQGEGGKLYRLLYITLVFTPPSFTSKKKMKTYSFRLPVQRISKM